MHFLLHDLVLKYSNYDLAKRFSNIADFKREQGYSLVIQEIDRLNIFELGFVLDFDYLGENEEDIAIIGLKEGKSPKHFNSLEDVKYAIVDAPKFEGYFVIDIILNKNVVVGYRCRAYINAPLEPFVKSKTGTTTIISFTIKHLRDLSEDLLIDIAQKLLN